MAKLIYIINTSLDGYIEDASGNFDWSEPDEVEPRLLHGAAAARRPSSVRPPHVRDDGRSGSRLQPTGRRPCRTSRASGRTPTRSSTRARWRRPPRRERRIEREFDPEAVRKLKDSSDRDLAIAGPELAAHAIAAGLVDEYHVVVWPVIVGGGKPWLPDGVRVNLELVEERRLGKGAVYLRYRSETATDRRPDAGWDRVDNPRLS